MSAPTPAGPEPERRGLQPPTFGRPGAERPRRTRLRQRFLAHITQVPDASTGDHDQDDGAMHR
ncbi:hypothetical protein [Streptomyces sp. NPDC057460]|uniref:hypothetical protein n=1 Tax=Streptomyces sp. NPDC057460 TaxID=3346141 RepID=UPI0036797A89